MVENHSKSQSRERYEVQVSYSIYFSIFYVLDNRYSYCVYVHAHVIVAENEICNTSRHRVINRNPYEAALGPVKCGVRITSLPDEILNSLTTEEDLDQAVEELKLRECLEDKADNERDENTLQQDEKSPSTQDTQ